MCCLSVRFLFCCQTKVHGLCTCARDKLKKLSAVKWKRHIYTIAMKCQFFCKNRKFTFPKICHFTYFTNYKVKTNESHLDFHPVAVNDAWCNRFQHNYTQEQERCTQMTIACDNCKQQFTETTFQAGTTEWSHAEGVCIISAGETPGGKCTIYTCAQCDNYKWRRHLIWIAQCKWNLKKTAQFEEIKKENQLHNELSRGNCAWTKRKKAWHRSIHSNKYWPMPKKIHCLIVSCVHVCCFCWQIQFLLKSCCVHFLLLRGQGVLSLHV